LYNNVKSIGLIIFIFHNLEKVLVRRTGAFYYKKALVNIESQNVRFSHKFTNAIQ